MFINVYQRFPVTFVRGKGPFLYSDQNQEYIDAISGLGVNCLGHTHPVMIKAAQEQSGKLFHITNLYQNDAQNLLAEKLVRNGFHQKIFLCNSGNEANELALKIVRKHGHSIAPHKTKIMYMTGANHGSSTGTLSISGNKDAHKVFGPLLADVVECEFNNIEEVKSLLNDEFCGIFIEPIQGENGIKSATKEFLETLRSLADQYNILLVFDEVECGMGRTGTLFAYEQYKVIPDVVTISNALGGGVPIAACLTKEKANEVLEPGEHGSIFGGNPFVCAIASAVVTELVDHGVVAGISEKASYVQKSLNFLRISYPFIEEIRGTGLLLGLKLKESVQATDFIKKAFEERLLLLNAGDNVVRFYPPLNITIDHIDEMMKRLERVLNKV